MAYDIYTLTGYILYIRDSGEWGKRYTFLSKDHGIMSILAVGISRPASKLRGYMMRFARIEIDVVHGKSGYRLVRARSGENGFIMHKKEAYTILCRFADLLDALMPEHAASNESFTAFEKLASYLENNIITDDNLDKIFYTAALELFSAVGYRQKKSITPDVKKLKDEYEHILNENGLADVI